jgi:hypothetical protein
MVFAKLDLLEVLTEAAKSELGIIALVILSISVVGVLLFRNSSDKIKYSVFVVLVFGICTFTYASIQVSQPASSENISTTSTQSLPSPEVPLSKSAHIVSVVKKSSIELDTSPLDEKYVVASDSKVKPGSKDQGFVYLGTYKNKKWTNARFNNAKEELKVGQIITLSTERKMFDCVPYRKSIFSLKYTYCNDVIGQSESGQQLEIINPPELIGLSRVWVYVREL